MRHVFLGSLLLISLFHPPASADGPAYGWIRGSDEVTDGYVLFSPYMTTGTYLIDNFGRVAKSWPSDYRPGASVYLDDDGNLLRSAIVLTTPRMNSGGYGGIVEVIDPSGKQIWEFRYSNDLVQQHHDIVRLPNGNILMIAWEYKTEAEAITAGRNPDRVTEQLWPETIVEIEPTATGATIVWRWHVWDHLIQDFDSNVENYGVVVDHPELVDINYGGTTADWLHFNGIAYNAELDQIMVTVHAFSEFWIIDHSTTIEEAASHEGGAAGRGGDILYRWGNPQTYGMGDANSKRLFGPHNANWIPSGYPGAGNILVFNNGLGRFYSTVEELAPPLNDDLGYDLVDGAAYGPEEVEWSYDPSPTFFAGNVSSAQRLSNGNTLICSGPQGYFFEVNDAGEKLWEYKNPVLASGTVAQSLTGTASGICFRATRIEPGHPALDILDLEPGDPLELYPHAPGDVDNDGDVDSADYAFFEDLYSGACTRECDDPLYPNALGRIVDFDGDLDVDCADWQEFANAWNDPAAGAPSFVPCREFLRGDVDGNASVQPISDSLFLLKWSFLGGDDPPCAKSADVNGSGAAEGLLDTLALLEWAFAGGPEPPAPGASLCGPDEFSPLGCDKPADCQ